MRTMVAAFWSTVYVYHSDFRVESFGFEIDFDVESFGFKIEG